ncbi:(deoxy)nucleoside triphosphate pyrophosphohydrolase [Draconibacterium sp.]|nr:(deoxy)nucleoside triphosphate pyrophosphohydrolase [Draconibacterium sp.]
MLKVTCALIIENRKLLITQNNSTSDHPFQWEFPGGKIKPKEKSEECIVREIQEELNVEVIILQKLKPIVFDYGIKKIHLIPFLCRIQSGIIRLNEHVDFKWIGYDELESTDFSGADKKLFPEKANSAILKKHIGK